VLAGTLSLFLAATAVLGAANAFTTPLLMAALAAEAPADRLGRALGWFGSLQAAGATFAPLLGGVAAEADWRLAFASVAMVAAVLAVVGVPAAPATARPEPDIGLLTAVRTALRPAVLRTGVVAALGWGCLAGLNFLVAVHLEERFGADAGTRGLVLTAIGVAAPLSARLVGGGVDWVGARRCVLLGAALGALVVAGMGLAPTVWLVVLAWAVGGVATQLVLVGVTGMVLGPVQEFPGGATSVVQAIRFGGGALSPLAFTPVYDAAPLAGFLLPAVTKARFAALHAPCNSTTFGLDLRRIPRRDEHPVAPEPCRRTRYGRRAGRSSAHSSAGPASSVPPSFTAPAPAGGAEPATAYGCRGRGRTSRGVSRHLRRGHPHDHADEALRIRILRLAVVLPRQLVVEGHRIPGGDRRRTADLRVAPRIREIEDRDADSRVASDVAVLLPSGNGAEEQIISVAADPHHRRLRAAVRVDRRQHRIVPAVHERANSLVQDDAHAPQPTIKVRPSGEVAAPEAHACISDASARRHRDQHRLR
jgi:MFS family permease